jgi:hypothetical protein
LYTVNAFALAAGVETDVPFVVADLAHGVTATGGVTLNVPTTGLYVITASLKFNAATTQNYIVVVVSGVNVVVSIFPGSAAVTVINVARVRRLIAGDTVKLRAFSNLLISVGSGTETDFLSLVRVGL